MTTLICSGTLFSDWQHILEQLVLAGSKRLPAYTELSAFNEKICQEQFLEIDDLSWRPFSPDEMYLDTANHLLSSVENEAVFTWADTNSTLLLNFWRAAAEDAKFILFYSSPEHELANYINKHSFDATGVKKVIEAWTVRTQAMLTFFLNNRDHSLLLNIQSIQSEDGLLIQTLHDHFGLNIEGGNSIASVQAENASLVEYLATTLLLNNEDVSEVFDEVRSTATIICEQDKKIENIQDRNSALIVAFLDAVTSVTQLGKAHREIKDELSLKQLQINQIVEELEYYFKTSKKQEKTFADYLSTDPLLKVARQARQM